MTRLLSLGLGLLCFAIPALAADQIIDNSAPGFSTSGSWSASALIPGHTGPDYLWASAGDGTQIAQWRFPLPSGGRYRVMAWWSSPFASRAPDAPYTIVHTAGQTTVRVDQRAGGGRWNDLGVYTFAPGAALVLLGNDAAGNPVADAVRIEEVAPTQDYDEIVDNASPGASLSGSWLSSSLVPGYHGTDYLWSAGGSGESKVEWSFQLPATGTYEVLAWWSAPFSTRSPDAPFTIRHAGGTTRRTLDQRVGGGQWNSLGSHAFGAGETRVLLDNAAQGNPVADAVRMRLVTGGGDDGAGEGPRAAFSASRHAGRAPLEVAFYDESASGSGSIDSWLWSFGDGATSTERHPVHVYTRAGSHSVSLRVRSGGQEHTTSRAGYVAVSASDGRAYDFTWPIEESRSFVLQRFGNQRIERGAASHSGTDFGVTESGVKVRAVANGWVERFGDFPGFGTVIMLRHLLPSGERVYSWYNHLVPGSLGRFQAGQFLAKGTVLGNVGESGWTPSGIHLHLEIKRDNGTQGGYLNDLSAHLDPYEFIRSRLVYRPSPPSSCSDGTRVSGCSSQRPLRCIEGGELVANSRLCGCTEGVQQSDNTCTKSEGWIVVDNRDPGFAWRGSWRRTTEVMGFYGGEYLETSAGEGATATWTPQIPASGYYDVYGWWRDRFSATRSSRTARASLVINHGLGRSNHTLDLTDTRREWKYIGTYFLDAGTGNSVTISAAADGEVVADAFGFAPRTP